jgi:hypothetical protein
VVVVDTVMVVIPADVARASVKVAAYSLPPTRDQVAQVEVVLQTAVLLPQVEVEVVALVF